MLFLQININTYHLNFQNELEGFLIKYEMFIHKGQKSITTIQIQTAIQCLLKQFEISTTEKSTCIHECFQEDYMILPVSAKLGGLGMVARPFLTQNLQLFNLCIDHSQTHPMRQSICTWDLIGETSSSRDTSITPEKLAIINGSQPIFIL